MTTYTDLNSLSESEYKKRIRSWTLYDWANSAFATTILAAVLPVYYSQVAGSNLASAAIATRNWSLTLSLSVFIVALISPILGTVSDIMRGKKKFLSLFVGIGVVGTGLLILVDSGDWLLASIFFIIGRIGFGAANVFYDALLPHIAKEEDQDRVSMQGYALGYLGGGLLLAINIVMIFTLPGTWGTRVAMFSVAIWWLLFSIPIFRNVPEPPSASKKLADGESLIGASFSRIRHTISDIRSFRDLFRFLIAFLIYNDGIGIIISVAAIYVAELGFGSIETILAILLVQFVGIPYSLIFGNIVTKGDARQSRFLAFVIFNILMLPLMGIVFSRVLSQSLVGTPSPDFQTQEQFLGQGEYAVSDLALSGNWGNETISGEILQPCGFFAAITGCDKSDLDTVFATADGNSSDLTFAFNGQKVALTYATAPDHGEWAVLMDGEPLMSGDEPVTVDAYSQSIRYGETAEFLAPTEGTHTLSLISNGTRNENSSGDKFTVASVDVLEPVRTSNLGAILGLLVGLQAIGALFALLLGPTLFKGLADRIETKGAIMLALIAYSIISIWGFFLNSVVEFWFLAWMVAVVQGGSQGLSRSLYASMTPTAMSGEFFGFFSIMSKFASFLSPLVFVFSVTFFDSSRPGVLALIVFFLIGMALLVGVDVERGKLLAKQRNEELLAGAS